MKLRQAAKSVGRLALDLLLPSNCLTCDQPVGAPGQLCSSCFDKTNFITAPCCSRCGVPFETRERGGAAGECANCLADPPPWGQARAALRYDPQSKLIILPLKYGDRVENARALAPMMVRAGTELLQAADWLVPVPLHRGRMITRRYNQAALLAQAISGLAGKKMLLDALQRVRATTPLAELSPTRRAEEVAGSIAVRASRRVVLQGSRVLLIDDVLTSGSTARECVAALQDAGVSRVDVLAAARVRAQNWDG